MNDNYVGVINNLIVLCDILDDYENFQKNFQKYMNEIMFKKNSGDFVRRLQDVIERNFNFSGKVKKFYDENKYVVDKINKYTSLTSFLFDRNLTFFYDYILNHKEDKDNILAVLKKLKQLGFDSFEFSEEIDFTNETYGIYTYFSENYKINYLDNLTAVADYNPGFLNYKTLGSSYKITAKVSFSDIGKYDKKIILNTLVFDETKLPSELNKKELFDKIINLKNEKAQEFSCIKDSVNLAVGIEDLYSMLKSVSAKINDLDNVEIRAQLVDLLVLIKQAIKQMQNISKNYNKSIASANFNISEVFLEEKKNEFVRKRENAKLHIW